MDGQHSDATQSALYGFYGRLSATFPSQVIIDTTEICNLACIHCPHPEFKKTELYAGRCIEPELCYKAVDEIASAGRGIVQYIRFTGEGEPLIHPKISEMLSYAAQRSSTTVSLTTNGTLLNSSKIDMILNSGIHVVDISIDAHTPETYAAIRVNGVLEKTRSNVQELLKISAQRSSPLKIVVSYVEQQLNKHETGAFEAFWKDQGASYVVVRRLHSNAGASKEIAGGLQNTSVNRRPCLYPWERISLTPRGELIFCPQDWVRGSKVADYRHTTINEIWQSDFYRDLREAHLKCDFTKHSFCGNCPDWVQTRWPGEGRSYADMIQDFKNSE